MLAGQTALTGTKELYSRDLQRLWNLRIHTRAAFKHLEIVDFRGAPHPRSLPFLRMAQKKIIQTRSNFSIIPRMLQRLLESQRWTSP